MVPKQTRVRNKPKLAWAERNLIERQTINGRITIFFEIGDGQFPKKLSRLTKSFLVNFDNGKDYSLAYVTEP